jgi:hypothetical protein
MTSSFTVGRVTVEVLDGLRPFAGVPTSQWHGDRAARTGEATVANLSTTDGLKAQVAVVTWPGGDEVSVRLADRFGGPADYERLEDAGEISPKIVGDTLVARVRALRYGAGDRASGAPVDWEQIDQWNGGDARAALHDLGATRTGSYGELLATATRFKAEPAIEVPRSNPAALFAIYALTRVMPIMTAFGKTQVEGPHS